MNVKQDKALAKLEQGGAVSKHKAVASNTKGVNLSIYFDGELMDYLTLLRYKYPKKARGALISMMINTFKENHGTKIPDSKLAKI